MSALWIVAIVVGSALGYAGGCGVVYAIGKHREWDDDQLILGAIFWPCVLPAVAAAHATRSLLERSERKQLPEARTVRR